MSPITVRRLSDAEATQLFPQRGHMDLAEYEAIFDEAEPGQAFEVDRDGLSERALKRRLGQSVKRVLGPNAQLRYRVSTDQTTLAFKIKPAVVEGKARKARTSRKTAD